MTNHPKALRLQTANIYLAHGSVGWHLGLNSSGWFWWLGRGLADLSWACSCVCGHQGQLGPTGLWWPRLDVGMTGAFLHEFTHPRAGQPRLTHVVVKGSKRVETASSLEARDGAGRIQAHTSSGQRVEKKTLLLYGNSCKILGPIFSLNHYTEVPFSPP